MVALVHPETDFWIAPDTLIEGENIRLIPLQPEYIDTLTSLGDCAQIWENFPVSRQHPEVHRRYLLHSLAEMWRGHLHIFVIEIKATGLIAGTTRLFHLNREHRQLEIGSWLHPDFWKSGINTEAKYLLLKFCFQHLNTVRVQFRTDATNTRSRQALEKMGASLEGIFRNERIREDGTSRDCAFYSILDREWLGVQAMLESRLNRYNNWQMAS